MKTKKEIKITGSNQTKPGKRSVKAKGVVLVTGAAGCVGSLVCKLLLEKGYSVRGIDLKGAEFPELPADRFTAVEGDLSLKETVDEVVKGVSFIVNTAAIVDISKSFDEMKGINLDAVQFLFEASKENGVEVFVHFSTGSVYKASDSPHGENDPVYPANDYVQTKLLSEEYLISRKEAKPVVNIIRPALIFGPKGKVLAGALATVGPLLLELTGTVPMLKGGARSNWVYAEDVARAAVFLLENPQPTGEIFNVANDDPVPIGEVFNIAFRNAGLKLVHPEIPMSKKVLKVLSPIIVRDSIFNGFNRITGWLWKRYAKKFGLKEMLTPRLDKEAIAFAVMDTIFDNRKLKERGFVYKYPDFEPAWVETVKWYRENRWIP